MHARRLHVQGREPLWLPPDVNIGGVFLVYRTYPSWLLAPLFSFFFLFLVACALCTLSPNLSYMTYTGRGNSYAFYRTYDILFIEAREEKKPRWKLAYIASTSAASGIFFFLYDSRAQTEPNMGGGTGAMSMIDIWTRVELVAMLWNVDDAAGRGSRIRTVPLALGNGAGLVCPLSCMRVCSVCRHSCTSRQFDRTQHMHLPMFGIVPAIIACHVKRGKSGPTTRFRRDCVRKSFRDHLTMYIPWGRDDRDTSTGGRMRTHRLSTRGRFTGSRSGRAIGRRKKKKNLLGARRISCNAHIASLSHSGKP